MTQLTQAQTTATKAQTSQRDDLVTTAPPKNRDVEAAKARARAELRYAR